MPVIIKKGGASQTLEQAKASQATQDTRREPVPEPASPPAVPETVAEASRSALAVDRVGSRPIVVSTYYSALEYDHLQANPETGEPWEIDPLTGKPFKDPRSHGPRPNGLTSTDCRVILKHWGIEHLWSVCQMPGMVSPHTDHALKDFVPSKELQDRARRL